MDIDLPTALLTIAAFVGGQLVIAAIGEWRATRDHRRQQLARDQDRQVEDELNRKVVRAASELARVKATKATLITLLQGLRYASEGRLSKATNTLRRIDWIEAMADTDPGYVSDETAIIEFVDLVASSANHLDGNPDIGRSLRITELQARISSLLLEQEHRAAQGDIPLRLTMSNEGRARLAEAKLEIPRVIESLMRLQEAQGEAEGNE